MKTPTLLIDGVCRVVPPNGDRMHTRGQYVYIRGRGSQCRRNGVHRGRVLGQPGGTSWTFLGVMGFLVPVLRLVGLSDNPCTGD